MNKLILTMLLLSLLVTNLAMPQNPFPGLDFGPGGVTALGSGGGSGTNGTIGLGLTHSNSNQLPGGLTTGSILSIFGFGGK